MFSSKSFVDMYDWASVYEPRQDSGRKKKTKSLLMNKEEKLKEYHQKLFILFSLSIILVPAKPAKRFSKSC